MKVAVPQWQNRVSPVFDVASRILLVDVDEGRELGRQEVAIGGQGPMERARVLRGLGTDVVICGAISRPMQMALASAGIEVLSGTCGEVDDVLRAYYSGHLADAVFRMPGSEPGRHKGVPG